MAILVILLLMSVMSRTLIVTKAIASALERRRSGVSVRVAGAVCENRC